MHIKKSGKEPIAEINSKQAIVQLEATERLQLSLEKILGSLTSRFTRAKGGTARRKIREGNTKVTLQGSDVTNIRAVKEELRRKEVSVLDCTQKTQ